MKSLYFPRISTINGLSNSKTIEKNNCWKHNSLQEMEGFCTKYILRYISKYIDYIDYRCLSKVNELGVHCRFRRDSLMCVAIVMDLCWQNHITFCLPIPSTRLL